MTEKMQNLVSTREDLLKKLDTLTNQTENYNEEEVKNLLTQAGKVQNQIDALEQLEALNKKVVVENKGVKTATNKEDGFKVIVNAIKTGRFVDALGDPLKTGGLQGEDYLLPEDVKLEINTLKREWLSAKELVTVINTTALSGSYNFGKDPDTGLVAFEDGEEIDSSKLPEFVQKKYNIQWYGAIIPVSNILTGAERAGLMQFLNIWFVRRAILTENKAIFDTLKAGYNGGTPKVLAGETALSASITKDIDPAFTNGGNMVVVTNQSGFAYLDTLKEAEGSNRPLLQPDVTDATKKTYKGYRIVVFSDAQLPNIDGTHAPIIYGSTKDGAWMHVYEDYFFDTDNGKGLGFTKNQTLLKVIEGFAVSTADASAYVYGSLAIA